MSISELGALGEFFGLFALLASLVYLAVQTKHSRQVAASQAARNVVADFHSIWSTLGEDIEKAHLIRHAVNDWSSLSKDQQLVVHSFFVNLVIHFTSALEQLDNLPELEAFVQAWEDNLMGLIQSEGGRQWYDECSYIFFSIVQDRVAERLRSPESLPPAWPQGMEWWKMDTGELSASST